MNIYIYIYIYLIINIYNITIYVLVLIGITITNQLDPISTNSAHDTLYHLIHPSPWPSLGYRTPWLAGGHSPHGAVESESQLTLPGFHRKGRKGQKGATPMVQCGNLVRSLICPIEV